MIKKKSYKLIKRTHYTRISYICVVIITDLEHTKWHEVMKHTFSLKLVRLRKGPTEFDGNWGRHIFNSNAAQLSPKTEFYDSY